MTTGTTIACAYFRTRMEASAAITSSVIDVWRLQTCHHHPRWRFSGSNLIGGPFRTIGRGKEDAVSCKSLASRLLASTSAVPLRCGADRVERPSANPPDPPDYHESGMN